MMRKNPGFTLVAVISLALGIGVNSAMFSLADALLFRPLSVAHPGDVVTLKSKTSSDVPGAISYRDYVDVRDSSQSFAAHSDYLKRLAETTPMAYRGTFTWRNHDHIPKAFPGDRRPYWRYSPQRRDAP